VQTDYLQCIFQAINTLLTQNLGFFDAMGQNLFRSFATILIAWYGIKSALSAAGGRHFLHFDNFASLLLTISFGFAMVNYYSGPIPGVGTSFHNLVTNEAQFLSSQIDQAQLQSMIQGVADFESRMDSPTWGDILGTAIYVLITILLATAQAVAIVVIAYGFNATAVCVLVGPWELCRYASLTEADLIFRNQAQKRFGGQHFEHLYRTWKAGRITEGDVLRNLPEEAPCERELRRGSALPARGSRARFAGGRLKNAKTTAFSAFFYSLFSLWRAHFLSKAGDRESRKEKITVEKRPNRAGATPLFRLRAAQKVFGVAAALGHRNSCPVFFPR
jgi:hypothetical protein